MSSDAQRLIEVVPQPLDRLGDALGGAAQGHRSGRACHAAPLQEPVDDLALQQRREEARVVWRVQQPDQPHHRVEQTRVQ